MNNYYLLEQAAATSYGMAVYGPVIAMVVMIFMAVPIWVVLGLGSIAMLVFTDVLPLSLVGRGAKKTCFCCCLLLKQGYFQKNTKQ